MKFTLVIQSAPISGGGSQSALRFTEAALRAGHEIYRLFFYADGVYNATSLHVSPQDEPDIRSGWQALIGAHGLDAVVCITAGLKRGLIDSGEARRYDKSAYSLHPAFELAGLGQLLDAAVKSDRVITFGG